MTISERVFARLNELNMTQKTFSERTGISQSTISEWKKKKTNPTSEKIMIICKVLEVSPEWLLSGADAKSSRSASSGKKNDWYVIDKKTELGEFVTNYNSMSLDHRARMIGYMAALMSMMKSANEKSDGKQIKKKTNKEKDKSN